MGGGVSGKTVQAQAMYLPYLPQRATIESLMWRPNDELLYTVSYRVKVN
jgi:hypothetical protein